MRKIITKACHYKNERRLVSCSEKSKNIIEVRKFYRARVAMQPFANNLSKDKRYAKTNWLCRCELERESELHILSENLRENYFRNRIKFAVREENAKQAPLRVCDHILE